MRRRLVALAAAVVAIGVVVCAAVPVTSGLVVFALYCIPTNSLLPVPHEPGLLYFAQHFEPVWIAAAGTLGAGVGALTDYAVVRSALRHPRVRGLSQRRGAAVAVRWFRKWPFVTVFVFALTPLPMHIVRVLAPLSGFRVRRYMAAVMLGVFPRFFALAAIGHALPIPAWMLGAGLVVLAAGPWVVTASSQR